MIKFFKKILYGLLKLLVGLFLCIAIPIGIAHLSSYLHTWTPQSTDEISYICYVAVDSKEQFIPFKLATNQPPTNKKTDAKQNGFDSWKLSTENQIKVVEYHGDDYNSVFRYRINNHQVEPLSCRTFGIADGMLGFFLTILLFILLDWGQRFYHWRKSRKLN